MIYVIGAVGSTFVKIGKANNPISRMRIMQTGIPFDLILLASANWPDSAEKRIHRVLRPYHVRGEWYTRDDNDKIDSLIKSIQSGVSDPGPWLCLFSAPRRLAKILSMAR